MVGLVVGAALGALVVGGCAVTGDTYAAPYSCTKPGERDVATLLRTLPHVTARGRAELGGDCASGDPAYVSGDFGRTAAAGERRFRTLYDCGTATRHRHGDRVSADFVCAVGEVPAEVWVAAALQTGDAPGAAVEVTVTPLESEDAAEALRGVGDGMPTPAGTTPAGPVTFDDVDLLWTVLAERARPAAEVREDAERLLAGGAVPPLATWGLYGVLSWTEPGVEVGTDFSADAVRFSRDEWRRVVVDYEQHVERATRADVVERVAAFADRHGGAAGFALGDRMVLEGLLTDRQVRRAVYEGVGRPGRFADFERPPANRFAG